MTAWWSLLAIFAHLFVSAWFIQVPAYGRKVYVVTSLRADTTFKEFQDLFEFYIKLQHNCSSCHIEVKNGLPSTFRFGVNESPLVLNGSNVNKELNVFYKNEASFKAAFEASKSVVTANETTTSPHLEAQLNWVVNAFNDSSLTEMTLKTVIIITNYYCPSCHQPLQTMMSDRLLPEFAVQNFTVTDLNLKMTGTLKLMKTSNSIKLMQLSRWLLESTLDYPISCQQIICNVALFFDLTTTNLYPSSLRPLFKI
ncbi:hypothetical protein L596_010648 [Steinernema carpocapsae]|uniref:Uncharacterized protein n=1 Tax=Steinernema carpocapsae TaxID=34508 RepID=A0A4U5PIY9_STECR|nr:hypothetical protein L596_010648 [Steinernema carpocapsae]